MTTFKFLYWVQVSVECEEKHQQWTKILRMCWLARPVVHLEVTGHCAPHQAKKSFIFFLYFHGQRHSLWRPKLWCWQQYL